MRKYYKYVIALAVSISSSMLCHGYGQDDEKILRGIKSLDFKEKVHDINSFSFECNVEYTGTDYMNLIRDLNEQLVSDGFGYLQLEIPSSAASYRLIFNVSALDTRLWDWRRIVLETDDGKYHTIIQGTNAISISESSHGPIFPNPEYAKTIIADGCPPDLTYYITLDRDILPGSETESDGGPLTFGPYWGYGAYRVCNEYLGESTVSAFISYYDIFQEDCLEPAQSLPSVIEIPSEGGVFTYRSDFYVALDSLLYRSIEHDMNTIGIPGYWEPGKGMKVQLMVVPLSGGMLESSLYITFICNPNFSTETRSQDTMFYLASSGKTVKLSQPGDPSASLEQFEVTGEWINDEDFTIRMSGSQPGVIYTLFRTNSPDEAEVKSLRGTGYPLDFGVFTGVESHGVYYVFASCYPKNALIGPDLDMTRYDDIGGNNYTVVRTLLDTAGMSRNTDVTYYNGLGYPVQEIAGNASGDGRAISTPIVYDKLRRPDAKSYLSYPVCNYMFEETESSLEAQDEYYSMAYGREAFPSYTHRTFETYAGGRVLSVRKPGLKYYELDKETKFGYRLNAPDDSIRMLRYIFSYGSGLDSIRCTGRYPDNTLACTMTVNEDADTSQVFVDTFGRTVLSRVLNAGERYDTYYVYDLKDSLVCAIQPEGVKVMPEEFSSDSEFAENWCFTYRYDAFGNVIESHVPGGGHKWTFYDQRNRPVFYTDDRMMADSIYRFIQYDQMDRVVMECLCTINRTHDEIRQLLESNVNPFRIFDSMSSHLRLTSYYDGFNASDTSGFRPDPYTGNAEALDLEHCITLPQSEDFNLEPEISGNVLPAPDGSESYVKRDLFYDSFGRTIQQAETFSDGSKSTYSYKYDFTGNVLVSSERHELPDGDADELVLRYTYDKVGRKTSCRRMLNGKEYPEIYYTYDDLGRIESVSVSDRISETYVYDLQGALSSLESSSFGETAFRQVLKYYDPSLQVSVPSYSGRISEIGYSDAIQDYQYMSYYYDHAGRLSDTQRTGDDGEPYGEYEERDMKYDANGNLLSMRRIMSLGDSTHLSFGYSGNRMDTVSADDSLWRYSYDSDGDMVSDGHRGLELSYNFLNLPSRIRIKDSTSLVYSYLSDGTMVSVKDSVSGNGLRFRGSFVYTVSPEGKESVESVSYGEGRFYACTRTPSADGADSSPIDGRADFIDTWSVCDYLGSVRMVIDIGSPEVQSLPDAILRRSDYLPFGMSFSPVVYSSASAMQGSDVTDASQGTSSRMSCIPQSSLGRWQYNGKPEQVSGLANTGLLDYGARFYDPYVARWTAVDPMADKYPDTCPYAFCANNPINFVDTDGEDATVSYNDSTNTITITVIIHIYGSLATDELAANYKASIYGSWGAFNEVKIDGKWYNLNWDVSVINIGECSGNFGQDGNNYMEVSNNKSSITDRYIGKIRVPRGLADTPMAHEFGHMIGVSDKYDKQGNRTNPQSGWEGNIMAEEAGYGIVEPRNLEEALSSPVKAFLTGQKQFLIQLKKQPR